MEPPPITQPKSPPELRTYNGIGARIAGYCDEFYISGAYYKQIVSTLVFIPVFFGDICLVKDAPNGGWHFLGCIKGKDFIKRFGWKKYFIFKFSVLFESTIILAIFIAAIYIATYTMKMLHKSF